MRSEDKASTQQSMALHQSHNNNNNNNNINNSKIIPTICTINCNNDIINNELTKENKINTKTRVIRLYRDGSTQLGFSIRGGWEHGTGIYVSEVHSGSEAAKQGLQAGDQIVRINGFSLEHAIHDEVIALVKSSSKVTLKVKSVGMIPVKDRGNDILTWKLLAPSTSPSLSSSPSPAWTSSDSHSDSEHDFLEASIFIDLKGRSLGCSVVKGPLNNPGIYVQSVKIGEIAEQSGLEVGDQIIQVNSVNVSHMDFSDAISKLKSLPSMTLTVKKGSGKHLFSVCKNTRNYYNGNGNKNLNNGEKNCIQKKKVTAIVHQNNDHSRMLSSSSNCSESSSGSVGKNCNFSDNDFSISEMEASDAGSVQNTNTSNELNDSAIRILEKVKQQEERLADERRKLEEEQQKLKLEMEKLEIEKKELEKRKQLEECNSLSNCSISSASASSSGSQSISFLEEIKMLGDQSKRNLRPVNSTDRSINRIIPKVNDNLMNNKKPEEKLKLVNTNKCDNMEKHKQHELLMEEFRKAHKRMFGENESPSQVSQTDNQNIIKDPLKESKSLPTNSSSAKIPPAVPVKKTSGPVVSIGTYNNNSFNNRFVPPTHRSVIQVRRDDTQDYTLADNKTNNSDKTNPQITIKVISTKQ